MPDKIILFLQASRSPFLSASLLTVIYASVLAVKDNYPFSIVKFLLAIIGVVFIHLGANLLNDFFDYFTGADDNNPNHSPFNGGSRMIQNRILTPLQVFIMGIACFTAGSIIGIILNYICPGNFILYTGIIGVALGFFYTAWPVRFSYNYLGEIVIIITFGILPGIGTYYLFAGTTANIIRVLMESIPIGVLVSLILFVNEIPDYEADKNAEKKTLVVFFGRKISVKIYYMYIVFYYFFIILLIVSGIYNMFYLFLFLLLPYSIKTGMLLKKSTVTNISYTLSSKRTIMFHLISGIGMTIIHCI